jgi:hypothetical protein
VYKVVSKKDCPLMFFTLTLQLLHHLTLMDYKKAFPVLTQLDYWTFLVEMLDLNNLVEMERLESREILRDMTSFKDGGLTPPYLACADPAANLDLVYMSINSILDFIFEAFKRDP